MAPRISLRRLFLISGVAMLLFMVLVKKVSFPLTTGEIVQFELAKDTARASLMINTWSTDPVDKISKVETAIQLDYIFIILYTSFFFLGTRFMGRLAGNVILKKAGDGFSWLIILAGVCDIIENLTMMRTLSGVRSKWLVHLTYDMALIKFSLIMIAAFFMLISFIMWILKRQDAE